MTNVHTSGRVNPPPTISHHQANAQALTCLHGSIPCYLRLHFTVCPVGDGFIRPEVTSLYVNGRLPTPN
ncbi:MAG: hypothetical protein FWG87_13420 [Defluviitaleaceae bacterium]|nr:hypothetical protein [Defluviitaleaceae bacterium]